MEKTAMDFIYDDFDQTELAPEASLVYEKQQLNKQEKLEQLKLREADLLKRQQKIKNTSPETKSTPNWPFLFPIIRFNLQKDIPKSAQLTIKYALYTLVLSFVTSILNPITVLCVTGLPNYSIPRTFTFAIIQGIATTYVCFNFIYTPIYSSCQKRDVPFNWVITMFLFICWCIYRDSGFPNSGFAGVAVFLDLCAKKGARNYSKILAFFNTALSIMNIFISIVCLVEAQNYQKISGRADDQEMQLDESL